MIYLAAPYSHSDPLVIEQRMKAVYDYMFSCIKEGKIIISPLIMHEIAIRYDIGGDFGIWGDFCIDLLKRCDNMTVLQLPGWEISNGLKAEISYCEQNNIPIEYIKC